MMKKVLIICNTYYQLLVGIQISRTIKVGDEIDIIVTDHSKNAKLIADNLSRYSVFSHVFYAETKRLCEMPNSKTQVLSDIFHGIEGYNKLFFKGGKYVYDELLFYNPDLTTHFLYATLYYNNPNIVVSRFEEGIMSYNAVFEQYRKLRIIYHVRKFLKKNNLKDKTEYYYCFYPHRYAGPGNPIRIPMVEIDSQDNSMIANLFGIDKKSLSYPERYIFFSGVYDFEGGEAIGELELATKIAKIVGEDNLLVKVHPRDNIQRFIDAGLKVDTNSDKPWEIVQLNYDFSKTIFITVASTSVLSISSIMEAPPTIVFAHRLFPITSNSVFDRAKDFCDSLMLDRVDTNNNIHFIDSLDELIDL